jgi:DNA-binding PadR family transcriptional regulator
VYTITPEGAKRLDDQRKAWKLFVTSVEGVLSTPAMKLETENG